MPARPVRVPFCARPSGASRSCGSKMTHYPAAGQGPGHRRGSGCEGRGRDSGGSAERVWSTGGQRGAEAAGRQTSGLCLGWRTGRHSGVSSLRTPWVPLTPAGRDRQAVLRASPPRGQGSRQSSLSLTSVSSQGGPSRWGHRFPMGRLWPRFPSGGRALQGPLHGLKRPSRYTAPRGTDTVATSMLCGVSPQSCRSRDLSHAERNPSSRD